jgi:hypothetical protein
MYFPVVERPSDDGSDRFGQLETEPRRSTAELPAAIAPGQTSPSHMRKTDYKRCGEVVSHGAQTPATTFNVSGNQSAHYTDGGPKNPAAI